MKSKYIIPAFIVTAIISGFASETKAQGYCREYTKNVTVGRRIQEAYGTACLQPDGSWQVVGSREQVYFEDDPFPAQTVNYTRVYERPVYTSPFNISLVGLFGDRNYGHGFHNHRHDRFCGHNRRFNVSFNDNHWGGHHDRGWRKGHNRWKHRHNH